MSQAHSMVIYSKNVTFPEPGVAGTQEDVSSIVRIDTNLQKTSKVHVYLSGGSADGLSPEVQMNQSL